MARHHSSRRVTRVVKAGPEVGYTVEDIGMRRDMENDVALLKFEVQLCDVASSPLDSAEFVGVCRWMLLGIRVSSCAYITPSTKVVTGLSLLRCTPQRILHTLELVLELGKCTNPTAELKSQAACQILLETSNENGR